MDAGALTAPGHDSLFNHITGNPSDDGNCLGRLLGRQHRGRRMGPNDIGFELNQFASEMSESLRLRFGVTKIQQDIPSIFVTEISKGRQKLVLQRLFMLCVPAQGSQVGKSYSSAAPA